MINEFVTTCQAALTETAPVTAAKELVERAVRDPAVLAALPGDRPGIFTLHRDAALTVLEVVTPPGYTSLPHDHRMWAVIGICSGREDNEFFRRAEATLEPAGGRSIDERQVLTLGTEVVHSVGNPLPRANTVAIHVYGGDLVAADRSMWLPDPWTEEPYDAQRVTGTTIS